MLLNRVLVFWCCVILARGFRQARTTRTGCVKNSYIIPSVPQEVEPWNMVGTAALTQRHVFLVLLLRSYYYYHYHYVAII